MAFSTRGKPSVGSTLPAGYQENGRITRPLMKSSIIDKTCKTFTTNTPLSITPQISSFHSTTYPTIDRGPPRIRTPVTSSWGARLRTIPVIYLPQIGFAASRLAKHTELHIRLSCSADATVPEFTSSGRDRSPRAGLSVARV